MSVGFGGHLLGRIESSDEEEDTVNNTSEAGRGSVPSSYFVVETELERVASVKFFKFRPLGGLCVFQTNRSHRRSFSACPPRSPPPHPSALRTFPRHPFVSRSAKMFPPRESNVQRSEASEMPKRPPTEYEIFKAAVRTKLLEKGMPEENIPKKAADLWKVSRLNQYFPTKMAQVTIKKCDNNQFNNDHKKRCWRSPRRSGSRTNARCSASNTTTRWPSNISF